MAELDAERVREQLDVFEDCLADLEDALLPLKLHEKDSKLSTYCQGEKLDAIGRAKMLVTTAYAIDSLLFCHLKATGVSTEKHTIMSELERIKQYVGKIKAATVQQKRDLTLNKGAANRIINHDLGSNAAHDRDRALRTAETNRRLQEKLSSLSQEPSVGMHTRFANSGLARAPQEQLKSGSNSTPSSELLSIDDGAISLEPTTEAASVQSQPSLPADGRSGVPSAADDTSVSKRTGGQTATESTSMFEESKTERKARERRERKSAKKDRQRQAKVKQMTKASETPSA